MGDSALTREIDIVPEKWIHWDNKKRKLLVKFMPPPYANEDIDVIHDFVKSKSDAPESWPMYNINVVGQASKFKNPICCNVRFYGQRRSDYFK